MILYSEKKYIGVTVRIVFNQKILNIGIGASTPFSITVPEAIELIRKIEEKL